MSAATKERVQELVSHYERSRDLQFTWEEKRERQLFYTIASFAVLYMDQINGDALGEFMSAAMSKSVGASLTLLFPFSRPIIWAVVSYCSLKYLQAVQHVEDNYTYIHKLEKLLAAHFKYPAFQKEGGHYKSTPSAFRWAVKTYYRYLVPLFLLSLSAWAGYREFAATDSVWINKALAPVVTILVLLSWWSSELSGVVPTALATVRSFFKKED